MAAEVLCRGPRVEGFRLLTLQTTRRSGDPYRVRLWFVSSEGSLAIISSMGRESWWVRHILRGSPVEGVIGCGRVRYWFQGQAAVGDDRRSLRATAKALYRKYYGWEDPEAITAWCRGACLVTVRPLVWLRFEGDPWATPEEKPKTT